MVAAGAGAGARTADREGGRRHGVPAAVLLEAAQDADHVVLGHRGRGWIASAVLGSVGLQCVLHATCPVTVVPRETPGSGARPAPG
jgi:nucleotide-binding universal stress UspA family protein